MTQCEQVLVYMVEHGSITQRDALNLGIYRLASRISDLRKRGYPIRSRSKRVTKTNGKKTYIAEYTLVPEELIVEVQEH